MRPSAALRGPGAGRASTSSLCQCVKAKPDLGEAAGLCSLIQQGQDDPSVVWG